MNADSLIQGNLFSYCDGNPIAFHDPDGKVLTFSYMMTDSGGNGKRSSSPNTRFPYYHKFATELIELRAKNIHKRSFFSRILAFFHMELRSEVTMSIKETHNGNIINKQYITFGQSTHTDENGSFIVIGINNGQLFIGSAHYSSDAFVGYTGSLTGFSSEIGYKNISTGQTAFLDKDIMNVGNETTLYSDQGTYIRGSNSYANKDSLIMCLLCVIGSAGAAMGLPASSAFYNFAY